MLYCSVKVRLDNVYSGWNYKNCHNVVTFSQWQLKFRFAQSFKVLFFKKKLFSLLWRQIQIEKKKYFYSFLFYVWKSINLLNLLISFWALQKKSKKEFKTLKEKKKHFYYSNLVVIRILVYKPLNQRLKIRQKEFHSTIFPLLFKM